MPDFSIYDLLNIGGGDGGGTPVPTTPSSFDWMKENEFPQMTPNKQADSGNALKSYLQFLMLHPQGAPPPNPQSGDRGGYWNAQPKQQPVTTPAVPNGGAVSQAPQPGVQQMNPSMVAPNYQQLIPSLARQSMGGGGGGGGMLGGLLGGGSGGGGGGGGGSAGGILGGLTGGAGGSSMSSIMSILGMFL